MTLLVVNFMTGQLRPSIYVDIEKIHELILCDEIFIEEHISRARGQYTKIGNGETIGIDGWRLYKPGDPCYEYVKDSVREKINWSQIEAILPSLPLPKIKEEAKQMEQKRISQEMRYWYQGWNQDNAQSGQQYQVW